MDTVVRLRSAVALVGRFPVLAGVDLDVAQGEILLLEGANGAGKTSLLRVCAGLLRVTAGEATVLGCDLVADPRAARRRTGLLGHAAALYDDLSVEDNLRFALRAARRPASAAGPALDLVGLTGRRRSAPVGALSAGQRRRVALAVLVARDPELWLLDEPHAGLDAEHRDVLDGLVRDAAGRGATVVLASHEHDRAEALAGRTAVVSGGAVLPATVAPAAAVAPAAGADPLAPPDRPAPPGAPTSAGRSGSEVAAHVA